MHIHDCTVYTIVPTHAHTTTPTNNNYIEYSFVHAHLRKF